MKYLHEGSRTKKLLSKWAGNTPLITAGFFFWYQGTTEQKSQNGLLQSLLYQTFQQQPVLILFAYHEAWQRFRDTGLDDGLTMTPNELARAIVRVCTQHTLSFKICLLIDGPDEDSAKG